MSLALNSPDLSSSPEQLPFSFYSPVHGNMNQKDSNANTLSSFPSTNAEESFWKSISSDQVPIEYFGMSEDGTLDDTDELDVSAFPDDWLEESFPTAPGVGSTHQSESSSSSQQQQQVMKFQDVPSSQQSLVPVDPPSSSSANSELETAISTGNYAEAICQVFKELDTPAGANAPMNTGTTLKFFSLMMGFVASGNNRIENKLDQQNQRIDNFENRLLNLEMRLTQLPLPPQSQAMPSVNFFNNNQRVAIDIQPKEKTPTTRNIAPAEPTDYERDSIVETDLNCILYQLFASGYVYFTVSAEQCRKEQQTYRDSVWNRCAEKVGIYTFGRNNNPAIVLGNCIRNPLGYNSTWNDVVDTLSASAYPNPLAAYFGVEDKTTCPAFHQRVLFELGLIAIDEFVAYTAEIPRDYNNGTNSDGKSLNGDRSMEMLYSVCMRWHRLHQMPEVMVAYLKGLNGELFERKKADAIRFLGNYINEVGNFVVVPDWDDCFDLTNPQAEKIFDSITQSNSAKLREFKKVKVPMSDLVSVMVPSLDFIVDSIAFKANSFAWVDIKHAYNNRSKFFPKCSLGNQPKHLESQCKLIRQVFELSPSLSKFVSFIYNTEVPSVILNNRTPYNQPPKRAYTRKAGNVLYMKVATSNILKTIIDSVASVDQMINWSVVKRRNMPTITYLLPKLIGVNRKYVEVKFQLLEEIAEEKRALSRNVSKRYGGGSSLGKRKSEESSSNQVSKKRRLNSDSEDSESDSDMDYEDSDGNDGEECSIEEVDSSCPPIPPPLDERDALALVQFTSSKI